MGISFIGERSIELLAWPEAERRPAYLHAVGRSYRSIWTWVGFLAFLTLTGYSRSLAERASVLFNVTVPGRTELTVGALQVLVVLCALVILGQAQLVVIRRNLRVAAHSRETTPPHAEHNERVLQSLAVAPNSAFPDKDVLLAALTEANSNAKWVVDKIWANAHFFATLTSALVSLTVLSILTLFKEKPSLTSSPLVLVLAFLPFIVIVLSLIGIANLRREYSRFLDWIATVSKLQEKLGLHEATQFRVFPADRYLLPRRFVEHPFNSSDDFHRASMRRRDNLNFMFTMLQWVYVVLSLFAIAVILAVYFSG